ncbi:(R)-mandelonitrile lyase-like [Macadamia integrifolia]|uniref:(R)-mandelonitrile lyase-like n=1 Tax=Macadamia integrifolia TaxID=60698 RepID=UPI001C4F41DE|nr:(R)-mandelonitrile lyase-like [Macadamia integrifolia]
MFSLDFRYIQVSLSLSVRSSVQLRFPLLRAFIVTHFHSTMGEFNKHIFPSVSFLLILFPWLVLAQPEQGSPYVNFVLNATELPAREEYDYIIVGGGTAGCPLAATLSEKYRVLLLERGGHSHGNPNLMTQEGFLPLLTHTDAFDSPAQAFTSEDGVPNARGRVLGGSSAINAGFYTRGDTEFFEKSGGYWDMNLVNQSYEWVEKAVVFRPDLRNWQSAIRDGLLEANVTPYNGYDLNHVIGTKIGGSTFDSSGRRHSAADLLNYANPFNIRIALHANVVRVIVGSRSVSSGSLPSSAPAKQAASGVVYRDGLGRHHRAMIRGDGEVILCAGAIGSPQLLLLSGIGSRAYLSSWGIPVVHHLPYVGQFMYDNPRNGISIAPPFPLDHSLIQVVGITNSGSYIEAASNIVPFVSPLRPIFLRDPFSPVYLTVATIMEKISGPLSTGSLRLASTDVRMNPVIRFNYFQNPVDLARCVTGMRKIGEVLRGRSMDGFRISGLLGERDFRYVGPALPFNLSDDRLMGNFCHRTVATIWHYHGGCLVGKVVDRHYRVIGLDGLRVVDGSTFTVSPGTNPQATLMMMGRYIGLQLISDRTT